MIKKIITLSVILILLHAFSFAAAAMTIEEEKKLGQEFYEKLEKSGVLYHNAPVNAYIAKLGSHLVAHMSPSPFEYRFSVIKSSAINAFATPGGYVYLNIGLINLAENESELASVMAHEIAHVSARHIDDITAKSTKVSMATLAAILAGAFLGSGDVAAAVTGFSMATATTLSLKYSREHEEEADRIGMSYMVQAGYDAQSMPDFLKIMRRYEFFSSNVPSYFLTHPGTDERIRYLDALLQTKYTKAGSRSIMGQLRRIQTILAFEQKNPEANLKFFQSALEKNPDDVDYLYGLAVTQEKLGLTAQALGTFHRALTLAPNDGQILKDMGIAYFRSGRSVEAIPFLKKVVEKGDDNVTAWYYLGKAYEAQGNYTAAMEIYSRLAKKTTVEDEVLYSLAAAYGKTNKQGESHYYFGLYFRKKNKLESASFHFREALKFFAPDSPMAKEIETYLKDRKTPPPMENRDNRPRPRPGIY